MKQANYIELKGLQYHIGCKKGDLAQKIILVGDPNRAQKVASKFDQITGQFAHREYQTFTGVFQGQELSVMATGIGEGNMEIAIVEISQIVQNPILIRCGSCSALSQDIALGSTVISKQALDLGNVCSYYDLPSDELLATPSVTESLQQACQTLKLSFHTGMTASAPGFYGPQGRTIEGFPIKRPRIIEELQNQNIINLEMEIATLFGLSNLKKIDCGAICAVYGNRATDTFLTEEEMPQAEKKCIDAALLALKQIVV